MAVTTKIRVKKEQYPKGDKQRKKADLAKERARQAKKVRICSLKLVTPNGVRIECGSVGEAINFLQKLEYRFGTKFQFNGMPESAGLSSDSSIVSLAEIEAAAVRKALVENHGNKSATARALGISRTRLDRKMDKYGIQIQCSVA